MVLVRRRAAILKSEARPSPMEEIPLLRLGDKFGKDLASSDYLLGKTRSDAL